MTNSPLVERATVGRHSLLREPARCSTRSYLARENLGSLERRLNPVHWACLDRSVLVNLDRIQEVVALGGEGSQAVLRDGLNLRASRRRVRALEERFGRFT